MASIFRFPTLWRGPGTYRLRNGLRDLGGRWSPAHGGWLVPPLRMVERQQAERLLFPLRRQVEVIALPPGKLPGKSVPDVNGRPESFLPE